MVLWGPPGTGKTTIALCVATAVDAEVEQLNAVTDGIKELRAVIARAEQRRGYGRAHAAVHRRDRPLEQGAAGRAAPVRRERDRRARRQRRPRIPGFELNRALVSRLQVHVVLPLQDEDLAELARRALTDAKRGVGIPADDPRPPYTLDQRRAEHLLLTSNGDARRLLGTVERAAQLTPDGGLIDAGHVEKAVGQRAVSYDKGADEHYAIISALHQVDPGLGP